MFWYKLLANRRSSQQASWFWEGMCHLCVWNDIRYLPLIFFQRKHRTIYMEGLLHWDFALGLTLADQVRRRFGSTVHFSPSRDSKKLFPVISFSSASFALSVDVALGVSVIHPFCIMLLLHNGMLLHVISQYLCLFSLILQGLHEEGECRQLRF